MLAALAGTDWIWLAIVAIVFFLAGWFVAHR